jgi:methyl-accepting chemotaxis protein
MEQDQILTEVLAELKVIRLQVSDNATRVYKTEISLESINKTIENLENYKERIVKLEGSMHYLNTTLDKTNTTLEKLDSTVDSIKEVLTIQKGSSKTLGTVWEVLKWVGVAGIIPALKAIIDHFPK